RLIVNDQNLVCPRHATATSPPEILSGQPYQLRLVVIGLTKPWPRGLISSSTGLAWCLLQDRYIQAELNDKQKIHAAPSRRYLLIDCRAPACAAVADVCSPVATIANAVPGLHPGIVKLETASGRTRSG